jgi:hypothetical protein
VYPGIAFAVREGDRPMARRSSFTNMLYREGAGRRLIFKMFGL